MRFEHANILPNEMRALLLGVDALGPDAVSKDLLDPVELSPANVRLPRVEGAVGHHGW